VLAMARRGADRGRSPGAPRRGAAGARVPAEHVAAPRVRLRPARGARDRPRVRATATVRAPALGALRVGGVLQLRAHASRLDDGAAQKLAPTAAFIRRWRGKGMGWTRSRKQARSEAGDIGRLLLDAAVFTEVTPIVCLSRAAAGAVPESGHRLSVACRIARPGVPWLDAQSLLRMGWDPGPPRARGSGRRLARGDVGGPALGGRSSAGDDAPVPPRDAGSVYGARRPPRSTSRGPLARAGRAEPAGPARGAPRASRSDPGARALDAVLSGGGRRADARGLPRPAPPRCAGRDPRALGVPVRGSRGPAGVR